MIQRIQTLYLSLASFISFFIYLCTYEIFTSTIISKSHFFLITSIILILIIFLYKKRSFQSSICLLLLILNLIVFLFIIYNFVNKLFLDLVLTLPLLIIVKQSLIFLARKAIIRDRDLIRSIDRIR